MKWTVTSLYLLVFISLLGFGSVLDEIYRRQFAPVSNETETFQQIFDSVVRRVSTELQRDESSVAEASRHLPSLFQLEPTNDFQLPGELSRQLAAGQTIILDSDAGISLHRRLQDSDWVLSFGPLTGTQDKTSTVEYGLTIVFYLGIALVLILWLRPLLRSVQQLSASARKIGLGELDTRLPERNWFLRELFVDYNRMAARLQELSINNQLFSQAVSHDLRTPLARIEFALEKLQQRPSGSDRDETIEKIRADIRQIENLTSELLDYARIGQTRLAQKESIDLHIFILQVIAEFEHARQTIAYQRGSEQTLKLAIDVAMFQKLMRNLIDNAVKYADSQILISLEESTDMVTITVEDDGAGIDKNLIESIFDPFVNDKTDSSRHFGLGLAICERVVSQHGGRIGADNASSLGGARLTVELPR